MIAKWRAAGLDDKSSGREIYPITVEMCHVFPNHGDLGVGSTTSGVRAESSSAAMSISHWVCSCVGARVYTSFCAYVAIFVRLISFDQNKNS